MKIELKKIKVSEHMSEETTAFTAEIHINGMNAGYAKNSGRGGSTDYHHNPEPEFRVLMQRAENFCLTLPPIKYDGFHGTDSFEIPMNLEHFIDELLEKHLKEKEQKKLEKKMVDTIIFGVPNGNSYIQIKQKRPLSTFPVESLQRAIDKLKADFKNGEVIMNTNLEVLGVKL
jgi:hypothetical protein